MNWHCFQLALDNTKPEIREGQTLEERDMRDCERNWQNTRGWAVMMNVSFRRQKRLWPEPTRGLCKKMDGIRNRYNLKSTGRIYTFAS